MSINSLIESNFPSSTVDLESSRRKFQKSIIIKQDENREGILSLLENDLPTETSQIRQQPSQTGQTIRPRQQNGDYR